MPTVQITPSAPAANAVGLQPQTAPPGFPEELQALLGTVEPPDPGISPPGVPSEEEASNLEPIAQSNQLDLLPNFAETQVSQIGTSKKAAKATTDVDSLLALAGGAVQIQVPLSLATLPPTPVAPSTGIPEVPIAPLPVAGIDPVSAPTPVVTPLLASAAATPDKPVPVDPLSDPITPIIASGLKGGSDPVATSGTPVVTPRLGGLTVATPSAPPQPAPTAPSAVPAPTPNGVTAADPLAVTSAAQSVQADTNLAPVVVASAPTPVAPPGPKSGRAISPIQNSVVAKVVATEPEIAPVPAGANSEASQQDDQGDANFGAPNDERSASPAPVTTDFSAVATTLNSAGQTTPTHAVAEVPSAQLSGSQRMDVIRQVADRIELMSAARPQQGVTVHLQPQGLGDVTIVVKGAGKDIVASFEATNSSVRAALADSKDSLTQAVADKGFNLVSVSVAGHSQSMSNGSRQPSQGQQQATAFGQQQAHQGASGEGQARRGSNSLSSPNLHAEIEPDADLGTPAGMLAGIDYRI